MTNFSELGVNAFRIITSSNLNPGYYQDNGYKKTLEFALRRKKMIMDKLKKYGNRSNELIRTVNFILDRNY